jgi:hypothetical protein
MIPHRPIDAPLRKAILRYHPNTDGSMLAVTPSTGDPGKDARKMIST